MHRFYLICVVFFFPLLQTHAQLASPGKLSNAHSKLEGVNNCAKCHNFGEKSFRENCLDCHKEIAVRVREKRGYHFYTRKLECSKCHKEHHGRKFELVRWNPEKFDHRQTGFLLEGKHDGLDCRKCHRPENIHAKDIRSKGKSIMRSTYLGLSTDCANCHEDEHRGQLKNCESCHSQKDWKDVSFSHARARFALEGRHSSVACGKCHPEKDDGKSRNGDTKYLQFRGIAFGNCTACHEDHHKGAYGKDCTQCHSPAGWKQLRIAEGSFDHSKTDFPLEGRHAAVQCMQCHTGGDFGKFAGADLSHCNVCHEDYHLGQFAGREDARDCSGCHTVAGFSPALFPAEKHAKTRFPLRGAHEAIPCIRCHVETTIDGKATLRFHWEALRCQDCHKDPHDGQFAQRVSSEGCESCHDTESWFVMEFDHSSTKFPLRGKHRDLLCEKCHVRESDGGSAARRFRFTDMSCAACHEDRHAGQFADEQGKVDCSRCHQEYGWSKLLFDHATMSRFPLTGRHQSLQCDRCHKTETTGGVAMIRYRPMEHSCSSCHPMREEK
ncbi:cytochrome c3 family protein [bacterium]|nr:cytochrome c3 family protein [bacterium]